MGAVQKRRSALAPEGRRALGAPEARFPVDSRPDYIRICEAIATWRKSFRGLLLVTDLVTRDLRCLPSMPLKAFAVRFRSVTQFFRSTAIGLAHADQKWP